MIYFVFFFFQAEDGIRDLTVTGVQTCALPIYPNNPVGANVLTLSPIPTTNPSAAISEKRGWLFTAIHQSCAGKLGKRFQLQLDYTTRSEEHTSELQSQSNLVCRLLLEKKKLDGMRAPRPTRP